MKKKGWLEEARDSVYATILTDDKDSRCFSMTLDGMLQFRKEILPVSRKLVNQDEEKLEQKTKKFQSRNRSKMKFIRGLKGFLMN